LLALVSSGLAFVSPLPAAAPRDSPAIRPLLRLRRIIIGLLLPFCDMSPLVSTRPLPLSIVIIIIFHR
jgi:hypothetical protein